jgi:hypothetical protein
VSLCAAAQLAACRLPITGRFFASGCRPPARSFQFLLPATGYRLSSQPSPCSQHSLHAATPDSCPCSNTAVSRALTAARVTHTAVCICSRIIELPVVEFVNTHNSPGIKWIQNCPRGVRDCAAIRAALLIQGRLRFTGEKGCTSPRTGLPSSLRLRRIGRMSCMRPTTSGTE